MGIILACIILFSNVDSQNMAIHKTDITDIDVFFKVVDNKSTDVYTISNLNAYLINEKLKDTFLKDTGDMMYFIEQTQGINFRAIYAISALESGRGKYLSSSNNYCGIKNKQGDSYRSFESKEKCLLYLANLLNHNMYKDKSLDLIGKIYCPTDYSWAIKVKQIMMEI